MSINRNKLLYVVIDGMGDRPIEELGNCTPLEFAKTDYMDQLASKAKLGLMYTVGKGISPESDVAVTSILGYDPYKYHVGRGPLEALGAGLNISNGDLALRCNFATFGENGRIIDRRVGRNLTTKEATLLSNTLNSQVKLESYPAKFQFKNTIGHRGILVIRSKEGPLSNKITNTDPAYERMAGLGVAKTEVELILSKSKPLEKTEVASISAQLVNEFTKKSNTILERHEINKRRKSEGKLKANLILVRDAGNMLPKFYNLNKHYGVKFACLADMPVERGISKVAGMQLVELPPPSGNIKTDMKIRTDKILSVLPKFDCFYIHLKGPDEPGHDGDFKRKTQTIAAIDKYFFGNVLPSLEKALICITADHATPCSLKAHSDDPVPLLISGPCIEPDGIQRFSERTCINGSLGVLEKGTSLLPMLLRFLKKQV